MCLKLEITRLNCFFQHICLIFLFLNNFDNSSPIADAFDPFLQFDAANECKSTYLAKNSVVMFLLKVKSIAELPAINPDKRSPNPARAVCESVPKSCQTFLLSATMLLAPLNKILMLNSYAASRASPKLVSDLIFGNNLRISLLCGVIHVLNFLSKKKFDPNLDSEILLSASASKINNPR